MVFYLIYILIMETKVLRSNSFQKPLEITSINSLRQKQKDGKYLTNEEKHALENFEKLKSKTLEETHDDQEFTRVYKEINILANLRSFRDFLTPNFMKLI